ncbi:helix-turn-helix domain-containing protein [Halobacterium litoreum]|uniref:Helix-turn-helix domain-containing protein n=1 Tax=Halobacterium litoreum TaxID=2039234 RepID=A0ABD5NHW2_9EURY|nr:helix-turn-helix domain-containing protein [Halobacterium litoreum]UHH12157.1 helix-turn-helix domain-containing protein [Halobacterium litoreum]
MKHVRVTVAFPPAYRHPMHQFAVERDDVSDYRIVEWYPVGDGSTTLLLQFSGDADAYRERIATVDSVEAHHVADGPGDSVFVYAKDTQADASGQAATDFFVPGIAVVPPVAFNDDGTVTAALVGPGEDVQAGLSALPDEMDVTVESVTAYRGHATGLGASLTDAQLEAVAAAVECGYYEPTRSGSVAEVGEKLGCSGSAAAERLRRAEAGVMAAVAERAGGVSD